MKIAKNKIITCLLLFLVCAFAFAKEKEKEKGKEKKVYTEKEFQKELNKAVEIQVDRLKKSSVADLTKELLEKERALQEKEQALERRKEQTRMAEESLAKRVLEFEKRQKQFLGCLDENKQKEAARIKQLVSVISNMKPLKAAELLSVQDSSISVRMMELIEPEKASRIFNLMDKEVSARLQKQYLNMRQ